MSERFEELSRGLAKPMPRRGMIRMMGVALAGGVAATVLKPFRGDAATCPAGKTPCGPACCDAGVACVNPTSGTCGCPAGTGTCGSRCCGKGETCSTTSSGGCCCPSGTTLCGKTCCPAGVACHDRARGICGCPAGRTPCIGDGGLTCCNAGTTCSPSNTTCTPAPRARAARCRCSLSNPCPPGQCCSLGTCVTSCPGGASCVSFGPGGGFCSGDNGCCSCSFFLGTICFSNTPQLVCEEFALQCVYLAGGTPDFTPGSCPTDFCNAII